MTTTYTLTVNIDGAAFDPDPNPELARILTGLAERAERGLLPVSPVRDINGNTVGAATITGTVEP